MTRARVTLTIDKAAKVICIRYIGELDGSEAVGSSIEQFADMENPWEYDHIFDLRRFDGILLSPEVQTLGDRWNQLVDGRDVGRLSAIISTDPLSHARISITRTRFPNRILEIFSDFDEGLDWIKGQRRDQAQARAV